MHRVASVSPNGKSPAGPLAPARWIVSGLFLAAASVVWLKSCSAIPAAGYDRWLDAVLILTALAATLVSESRRLPGQNVLLAAGIIAAIGTAADALNTRTGIPFGPRLYAAAAGPEIFGVVPWFAPFIWVVFLLNSRGIGRLILRPWRKTRRYGFWLMGITGLLAAGLDLGLETFAARVNHYWFWLPTKIPVQCFGAPLTNFLGWIVTSLLILAFATPALINKRPVRTPPEYHSLAVWLVLNALFASAAAWHHLWPTAICIVGASVAAAVFAIRGARW